MSDHTADMGMIRQRPNFAAMPYELADDETISAQAKTIYVILDRFSNYETGLTFVGRDTVAAKAGFKKADSIDKYLDELRDKGWISWRRRWRKITDKKTAEGRLVYEYSYKSGQGFEPTTNLYHVKDRVAPQIITGEGIPPTEGIGVPPAGGRPVPPTEGTNENQVNENQVNENQVGASAPSAPNGDADEPHRIPNDWKPTDTLWSRMRKKYPHLNLNDELKRFVTYWDENNTKQSMKKDWGRAWQNWLGKANTSTAWKTKNQQASQWADNLLNELGGVTDDSPF